MGNWKRGWSFVEYDRSIWNNLVRPSYASRKMADEDSQLGKGYFIFHVCLLFDTVQNRRCSVRVVGGGIDHYNTIPVLLFC